MSDSSGVLEFLAWAFSELRFGINLVSYKSPLDFTPKFGSSFGEGIAKNENIKGGLAQCIAEMYAAQLFNKKENINLTIYGAVTSGTIWQFLILEGDLVCIDLR